MLHILACAAVAGCTYNDALEAYLQLDFMICPASIDFSLSLGGYITAALLLQFALSTAQFALAAAAFRAGVDFGSATIRACSALLHALQAHCCF